MRRPTWALGVGLALVLLALLLGVPLTALARVATGEGLAGLRRALSGPAARTAIGHTLAISVAVTALALPAGAALAMAVERRAPAERRAARLLIAAPLLIPEFVLGFAWTQAYGPAGLGDQVAGVTIPGLYGPVGIVCVLTTHAIPLAYLAVAAGLALRADPGLLQAARSAGAGPVTALRTITLPLLRVPLLAGAALVFVSAVNSFAVPRVLGAPAGFATMSTLVYTDLVLSADPSAFTDLTVLALAMAVLVMLALGPIDLWLGGFAARRRRSGFGGASHNRSATPGDRRVALALWAYTGFAVGAPMLAVALTAVTRGQGLPPVPGNWTLANFSAAFRGDAGAALARTVWLSAVAAALAPLLGGLVAGVSRRAWRGPMATLVTLAFAVPGSALAVGVLIGYGRWLPGSALLIVLAYLAKFWAFGHRPIQAALDRISPDLVLAARSSGANAGTALRTVILPPLTTALLGSAALIFLVASHELTMSSILYGPGSQTFAVVIANQHDLGGTGTTAALALVLALPILVAGGLLTAGAAVRMRLVALAHAPPQVGRMSAVACLGLSVGHQGVPVLTGVDLCLAEGEVVGVLGPSGSGKSTLLHAIAGFVPPLAGEIHLSGRLASTPARCTPPERRSVGMVFQDYALWPHLDALDVVAYPYRRRGLRRDAARQRAADLLATLGMIELAGRRPADLSGGEQQRVGLARALACEPAVYLFDEPTAHLDAHLRGQVLAELAQRRAASGAAAIFATHDHTEAMAIADRVAVLHSGRVAQVGTPAQVYAQPNDLEVARLTGPVSVLRAPVNCHGDPLPDGAAILVRPDWAVLDGELPGTLVEVRFGGPHTDYHLTTQAGEVLIRESGPPRYRRGDVVSWTLRRGWPIPG